MKPKISVIMSTLNTNPKFLFKSIESILQQTFSDFEFIIVVDGGNDDLFIQNNFNDNRIRILKHDSPKGLAFSLNEAIYLSKGKYIARMDSDDISINTRFNNQFNYMEKNVNIDITSMYYRMIGDTNKNVAELFCNHDQVKSKLFFINVIAHPCVMFRKSSINKYDIKYDIKYIYSQDYELWTRYCDLNIAIIPKYGLYYRIHHNQVSFQKKMEQQNYYYEVLKRNLYKLDNDMEDIQYLLMLNGKNSETNIHMLYKFINKIIIINNKIKIYPDCFKSILKIQFLIVCIKSKNILNKYFFMNFYYFILVLLKKVEFIIFRRE